MARVQLHTLYSPAPVPCGFTHVNPRLHLAGRSARGGGRRRPGVGGEEEEETGAGGGGAALPSPSGLRAALTPAAHRARGRPAVAGVRAGPRRGLGDPRRLWPCPPRPPPHHHPPHRPSALGLFHWRTLPKMVICVRGRECGFPSFRVTWRERDSLAGPRARVSGSPNSTARGRGAGRGRGPESGRAGLGAGFHKNIAVLKSETDGAQ